MIPGCNDAVRFAHSYLANVISIVFEIMNIKGISISPFVRTFECNNRYLIQIPLWMNPIKLKLDSAFGTKMRDFPAPTQIM